MESFSSTLRSMLSGRGYMAERMVRGKRTELTYKVTFYWWTTGVLGAEVYEPYMRQRRWFGLVPACVAYKFVFDGDLNTTVRTYAPKPSDYERLGRMAVDAYEDYKLAWEAHESKKEA